MDWEWRIREATEADSEAMVEMIGGVAAERVYTAITEPWSIEQQRAYLDAPIPREAVHVAEIEGEGVGLRVQCFRAGVLWDDSVSGDADCLRGRSGSMGRRRTKS